jgi:hypothetical protein
MKRMIVYTHKTLLDVCVRLANNNFLPSTHVDIHGLYMRHANKKNSPI